MIFCKKKVFILSIFIEVSVILGCCITKNEVAFRRSWVEVDVHQRKLLYSLILSNRCCEKLFSFALRVCHVHKRNQLQDRVIVQDCEICIVCNIAKILNIMILTSNLRGFINAVALIWIYWRIRIYIIKMNHPSFLDCIIDSMNKNLLF